MFFVSIEREHAAGELAGPPCGGLCAADDAGRLSLHVRNGSMSASALIPGGAAVRCSLHFNTFSALCTDNGVYFYEGKDRRLLKQYCMVTQPLDEGMPELDPILVKDEGPNGEIKEKKVPPHTP